MQPCLPACIQEETHVFTYKYIVTLMLGGLVYIQRAHKVGSQRANLAQLEHPCMNTVIMWEVCKYSKPNQLSLSWYKVAYLRIKFQLLHAVRTSKKAIARLTKF